MDNVSTFLAVLRTAIAEVDAICGERTSDYWDTLGAILRDKHFIRMVTVEMKDPAVLWPEALRRMLVKADVKLRDLPESGMAGYVIEVKGACKFLVDRYGSAPPA
jgi:hypothetical protein